MLLQLLLLAMLPTADVGTSGKLPTPGAAADTPVVVASYTTTECQGGFCMLVRWEWQRWKKHPNVLYLYRIENNAPVQAGGYWDGAGRQQVFRPFRNGTWGPESVAPVPIPVAR